jgi:hypothetical protein
MTSTTVTLRLVVTALLALVGCAGQPMIYPITTGFHTDLVRIQPEKPKTVMVWGADPGAVNAIVTNLQVAKARVVERTQIEAITKEQQLRLTTTPEAEANLLRVGRFVGADWLVLIENHETRDHRGLYQVSVAIRCVSIESGVVRWSGTSYFPEAVPNLHTAYIVLATHAMAAATCPWEEDWEWINPGPDRRGGCFPKVPGSHKPFEDWGMSPLF